MAEYSLERTLRDLHRSGICAGAQTFPDSGLHVWLGDVESEIREEVTFGGADDTWPPDGAATQWLCETARRLYPDTAFANSLARQDGRPAGFNDRAWRLLRTTEAVAVAAVLLLVAAGA